MVKKTKKGDSSQKEEVLNYMNKVNRPYSASKKDDERKKKITKIADIFQNLHATCPKSEMIKVLDYLVKEEKLISKTYGKSKIYAARQDLEIDAGTLSVDIKEVSEALETIKKENLELESKIQPLNLLSKEEAWNQIQHYQKENQDLEARIDALQTSAVIPSEKRKRVERQVEQNRAMWKKRRRMFKTIFDTVTEHMPGNPNEFKETLGIEEDVVSFDKEPF